MNLKDMQAQVVARLPEERRQVLEALLAEFEPGETMRLLLSLVAAATQRERQLVRLLMTDIEKMEAQKMAEKE